jgi:hypothetical protein
VVWDAEQVGNKNLLMPCLRNSLAPESQAVDRRDFDVLVLFIELIDRWQFAGKFVVSPINTADIVVREVFPRR